MPKIPSYKITELFSPKQFNQTDFGHIYFNLPKEIQTPATTEALAQVLKQYHLKGEPVTIRNTGHSVNGQTLTSGAQINIGELKKIHFDKEKLEVTAGAGNSWDEVLRGVEFPSYCLPVFPNNPGQQIKIGGTASVGGVGPYASKHGGFWHCVQHLKLVTMKGDIVSCSRTQNPEIFQYALGGFGRIGVISEVTLAVIPSKKDVLGIIIPFMYQDSMQEHLQRALADPMFDGVVPQVQIVPVSFGGRMHTELANLLLLIEVNQNTDIKKIIQFVKKTYHQHLMLFVKDKKQKDFSVDFSFGSQTFSKKDLVYFFPTQKGHDQLELLHPWTDFIVAPAEYPLFVKETRRIIHKYGMAQYLLKDSLMHDLVNLDILINYCIRKIPSDFHFPLSLDLPDAADFSYSLGVMPVIPPSQIEVAVAMGKELTDLIYQLKGKRYLYGIHSLTRKQVVQQFGRATIQQWQTVKDTLDPKHLLNIGVIEHLDR